MMTLDGMAQSVTDVCGLPLPDWMPSPPPPKEGMLTVPYGGWDVEMLQTCIAGRTFIAPWEMDEALEETFCGERPLPEVGYYHFDFRAHGGDIEKRIGELNRWEVGRKERWFIPPTPLTLSALLINIALEQGDPLGGWPCCCGAETSYGSHPVVRVRQGRLHIDHWWGVKTNFQYLWPLCTKAA